MRSLTGFARPVEPSAPGTASAHAINVSPAVLIDLRVTLRTITNTSTTFFPAPGGAARAYEWIESQGAKAAPPAETAEPPGVNCWMDGTYSLGRGLIRGGASPFR